jgi:hypothetical protein
MRTIRATVGALALLLLCSAQSGCTILLWSAATDPDTREVAPREVVSAWVDRERTLHLGVRFEDGVESAFDIALSELVPCGGDLRHAQYAGPLGPSYRSSEPIRIAAGADARADAERPPPTRRSSSGSWRCS